MLQPNASGDLRSVAAKSSQISAEVSSTHGRILRQRAAACILVQYRVVSDVQVDGGQTCLETYTSCATYLTRSCATKPGICACKEARMAHEATSVRDQSFCDTASMREGYPSKNRTCRSCLSVKHARVTCAHRPHIFGRGLNSITMHGQYRAAWFAAP